MPTPLQWDITHHNYEVHTEHPKCECCLVVMHQMFDQHITDKPHLRLLLVDL